MFEVYTCGFLRACNSKKIFLGMLEMTEAKRKFPIFLTTLPAAIPSEILDYDTNFFAPRLHVSLQYKLNRA